MGKIEDKIKVYLVGRHKPDFGDENVEVVAQENVQFGTGATEILGGGAAEISEQLDQLFAKAEALDALVVFQAVPAQVAVVLARRAREAMSRPRWGVVVSKPAARPAPQKMTYKLEGGTAQSSAELLASAVRFANPRATVKTDVATATVTVETAAPMRFEFDCLLYL